MSDRNPRAASHPSARPTPAARAGKHGRVAERKQRTAEAILEAGIEVFERRGYQAATIDEIAQQADVAVGSIYNHFEGKPGIALALAERALATNERYMAEAWALEASPLERLIAAAGGCVRFAREDPAAFRTIVLPLLEPGRDESSPAQRQVAERVALQLARLESALAGAVAAGQLRPLDVRATARFLWGAWTGVVALGVRSAGGRPGEPQLSERQTSAALEAGLRALLEGAVADRLLTREGRLRAPYARALHRAAGTGQRR